MRDIKRIERILKMVKRIWLKYPDLRLMQLLGNVFPPEDNYNKEDQLLEELLVAYYGVIHE